MVTVAAVQATPVFLDAEATAAKASLLIKEAAQTGAMALRFLLNYHPLYAKVQSAQVKPEA